MSPDLFYRVIDEIASEQLAEAIALHVFGEPLIHRDVCEFIKYVKNKGLKLNITTNASLLEDKHIETICSFMQNDEDSVHISFRSTNEAVFGIHGCNDTFDNYLRRIQDLIKMKISTESPFRLRLDVFWKTIFNYPVLLRNSKLMEYILDAKSSHKLVKWIQDIVSEKPYYDKINYSIFGSTRTVNFHNNIVLCFQPLTESIDSSFNNRMRASTGYCDMRYFTVFCDGKVGPCCNNYDARISFGNVNDRSLKEILFDQKTLTFRKKMSCGKLPHEFCKLCRGHTNILGLTTKQVLNYIKVKIDPYGNRKFIFREEHNNYGDKK
ncbi:Fe-S oxidoreductase [Candidatus Scalindua japonica]|uniref:Fe-S oxidoreductase n=2 Tax=Candidatus Scalindua japonica TaxID=1284222 RepID=A0A286TTG8_9BACT|nr:Fe-S oxidoreductase [Candidatus Scalindua japonica]